MIQQAVCIDASTGNNLHKNSTYNLSFTGLWHNFGNAFHVEDNRFDDNRADLTQEYNTLRAQEERKFRNYSRIMPLIIDLISR